MVGVIVGYFKVDVDLVICVFMSDFLCYWVSDNWKFCENSWLFNLFKVKWVGELVEVLIRFKLLN